MLLKYGGTDATSAFTAFHAPSVIQQYGPQFYIGELATAEHQHQPVDNDQASSETFGNLLPFSEPMWYQGMASPYYADSHRQLRQAVRAFVDIEIIPFCHEWDESKALPPSLYKKLASHQGLLAVIGAPIPESLQTGPPIFGVVERHQYDVFHWLIVLDELSRCGSGGVCWGLLAGLAIGLPPIVKFGSSELQKRVVPSCLSGDKRICLAITEPYAGSDVANIRCEAKLNAAGTHFLVNGEKKFITNAIFSDYMTLACRTGGEGMKGISLLLVEMATPGVKTRLMDCSGVWSSGTTYITLEDVQVPVGNIIGTLNEGFRCIVTNFNFERLGVVVQALRFARICLSDSIAYASKRKVFGKRLIDHSVIRYKLAQMSRQVEAGQAWLEVLVYQMQNMDPEEAMLKLGGPIALLKAQSTLTLEYCAREAAQIFGGLAYTRGGQGERVERIYREVRAYAIPGGSEEIMLELGVRQSLKVAQMMECKL